MSSARGATKEVMGNVFVLGWQMGAAGGGGGGLEADLQHCGDVQGLEDTTRGREWTTQGNWCRGKGGVRVVHGGW
jgi:hypothetical protein